MAWGRPGGAAPAELVPCNLSGEMYAPASPQWAVRMESLTVGPRWSPGEAEASGRSPSGGAGGRAPDGVLAAFVPLPSPFLSCGRAFKEPVEGHLDVAPLFS